MRGGEGRAARRLLGAASALAALLLSGCGVGQGPLSSAAAKDVRQRAENAGYVMAQASRSSSAVEHARRVVGDVGSARIELLQASGTGANGAVVLRITSVHDDQSPLNDDSSASACFRYAFGVAGRVAPVPEHVDCPGGDPLPLPPPPFDPDLPPGALDRLERLLGDPTVTHARLERAFPERGVSVRTATVDGSFGVAVAAGPGECAMGRRTETATVETWPVPAVLAQPGELGCDPAAAARGLGKDPPH